MRKGKANTQIQGQVQVEMRRGEAKTQVKAESEEELRGGYARSNSKASQDPRTPRVGVVAVHERRQNKKGPRCRPSYTVGEDLQSTTAQGNLRGGSMVSSRSVRLHSASAM